MYVVALEQVPMCVMGLHGHGGHGQGAQPSASYPQSIDREVVHAQCYHTSTPSAHEHVRCLPPHPHLGTVQTCLGTRPARCSPTWGHSEARCCPNVAPPPPVRGLPNILQNPLLVLRIHARGCNALRSLPRLDGALGVPIVGVHDAHRSTTP